MAEAQEMFYVGVRGGEGKGTCSLLSKQNLSLHGSSSSKGGPYKAIKGQPLADFLADHLIPSDWKLCEDLSNDEVFFTEVMEPWIMYFDGATRRSGAGTGIVLISSEKHMLPYSFVLAELCSNNVVGYQELIIDLQMGLEIRVSFIEIYG
ncbi:uncharacterized protein E6C27_scaffold20G00420 [Cucumis melo var. makuwa]|uniref:RNase H type-1 domain-containing protein n=1 Tax=Cucumis melo var. makuwa TaxID=1194695 RepID=A0A5A7T5C3_CUCMM|nr:uncharacterized protein E6C27_scaffold20G00420 [Cucumis melo var. makuwa]